ncbi:MAG: DUF420 domain-containing protein [Planctomycetota bacterium]
MLTRDDLPVLNAILNASAGVIVFTGWVLIKRGLRGPHKAAMLTGICVSTAFLVSYLIYHFTGPYVSFAGPTWAKIAYLIMLFTHVVLAIVMVPMIAVTVVYAFRNQLDKHRRIARWTFGIWMYVSVTGVVVYVVLYMLAMHT